MEVYLFPSLAYEGGLVFCGQLAMTPAPRLTFEIKNIHSTVTTKTKVSLIRGKPPIT